MQNGASESAKGGEEGVVLTREQAKSRRARNVAIGVAVALFVAFFYFVTIVKLGGNAIPRGE